MPKTPKNFRLTDEGIAALDKVAKHFGLTQTATIEFVMRELARRDMRTFTYMRDDLTKARVQAKRKPRKEQKRNG